MHSVMMSKYFIKLGSFEALTHFATMFEIFFIEQQAKISFKNKSLSYFEILAYF